MSSTIAHLVYSFNVGGLERVIVNLINSCNDDDVRHVIICQVPEFELAAQVPDTVKLYSLDKKPGNDISSHIRLFQLLRKIRPDVLHTYNFGTFEYQITAFLAGVKVRVHAEHGRDGEYDAKVRRRRSIVRRIVLPFLHHFIVVSPDLFSWAKDTLKLREPKLQFVYNGIDVAAFECDRNMQAKSTYTFIAVGRLAEVKNHGFLIDAFDALRKQMPDKNMRLQVVGDGPCRAALTSKIQSLQLEDCVQLLGARDDIPQLLCEADTFVLSSTYEAMPMTLLEAMASGLPVISTRVGGVENIVQQEVNGLLVESNNVESMRKAMQKLVQGGEMVERMIDAAHSLVAKKFSSNAMTQHYLTLYKVQ